jgi:hypothetical protein
MWLPLPAQVRHDGERAYALQGVLVQEFSANADGIRQDFILTAKPAGTGPLHLDLAFENASLQTLPAASDNPESRGSAQTPESRRSAQAPQARSRQPQSDSPHVGSGATRLEPTREAV